MFLLKATGRGRKMAKTKVVQKNTNSSRRRLRVKRQVKTPRRDPKEDSFVLLLILFYFLIQKIENESISGSKFSIIHS